METRRNFHHLKVYDNAFKVAMRIFFLTKGFPKEERFSMVDQMRRSSRSVCSNLAEAWRKRRYRAAFVAKLNDAEGEASETMVWLEMAKSCGYLDDPTATALNNECDHVIAQIVRMISTADQWAVRNPD